ncbi:Aliphatic sulfonates import ATP-binding protein SsuB [Methylobacterium crusticola]|uniref:Aliphatic sulfonates import ATP-binding protein SsuB n=1 Tax=Methylobacterium crusticola TaxID=1697972 RepID=A0ABQ4R7L3_9HYPH|nr:ABC transporter ATP-binding protein [Methylobacterium crusticola]GJD53712.1 Aliphatic sulfonates import ATP-binding protein SsuB [Methylobacterium crusticola]
MSSLNVARLDREEAADARPLALELHGVRRLFGTRAVLDGIELAVRRGEFVSLLGASGTGKTTLLRILAGLDRATSGHVRVAAARSVVFQEPRLVPAMRVWRNVVLGHSRGRETRRRALDALAEVGLGSHADAWPRTLSGGEAQRVALARALATEPGLLLLDEPFAALDALTRIRMHALVSQLCERHQPAVVLVTHDVDEAILLSDRILVLAQGGIRFDARVPFPRPRQRLDNAFGALRARLLAELGVAPEDAVA